VSDEAQRTIWIKTDMAPGHTGYVVTLEAGPDMARIFNPTEAMAYASGLLAACAEGEYDAAVLRQMISKLGLDSVHAAAVIQDLRADRAPLDDKTTWPLAFEIGITAAFKPFLKVAVEGQETGQWEIKDARAHAMAMLESVSVADLDSGYLQVLMGAVGLERNKAMQVIDDLRNYREEG
jgi:hypothetical protein